MASQDWFDKDFYKTLGVSKDVSEADLKKAYRKLARKYHPDSNQGDAKAEATFKEISEAYSVLSDAEQRKEYDEIRAMGSGARFTAGGSGAGGFEDVFSRFGQEGAGSPPTSRTSSRCSTRVRAEEASATDASGRRAADSAASAARSAVPMSRPAPPSTSSPPCRGDDLAAG